MLINETTFSVKFEQSTLAALIQNGVEILKFGAFIKKLFCNFDIGFT